MKGRRKIKDSKWAWQAKFDVEAKRSLARRSKKASHRFFDALTPVVIDQEPTGRLAGAVLSSASGSNM